MPTVSKAFFSVATLCVLAGMIWGSIMGKTGDHSMMPAHAHLNLLGWVTLSIMGGFYSLPGTPKGGWLPWTNFVLSAFGALAMAVLLPHVLKARITGAVMPISEVPAILGVVVFLISVLGMWRKAPAAA